VQTSPPRATPRFLDQRLELLGLAELPNFWRAWGCSYDYDPSLKELVSLAPMLKVKINREEPVDLHEQVAAEIRRAIADGEAKPGERLPPAKDLAAVLGVNTNTVLRALRQLRDEDLLEFRRGRGIRVAGTPELGLVVAQARALVELARRHGYRIDELVGIIEDVG
jgi:GntR family transcriptional regulator